MTDGVKRTDINASAEIHSNVWYQFSILLHVHFKSLDNTHVTTLYMLQFWYHWWHNLECRRSASRASVHLLQGTKPDMYDLKPDGLLWNQTGLIWNNRSRMIWNQTGSDLEPDWVWFETTDWVWFEIRLGLIWNHIGSDLKSYWV